MLNTAKIDSVLPNSEEDTNEPNIMTTHSPSKLPPQENHSIPPLILRSDPVHSPSVYPENHPIPTLILRSGIVQHQLGQYFTTNAVLKQKVCEFILNNPDNILEPSIGQGDLVQCIAETRPDIDFDMYEIDPTIKLLDNIPAESVIYCDFMQQTISKRYKTIVGNPPYVRTKTGNLYIDFTEKCYHLLEPDGGELIFIVPSDFLKLTSASKLLNKMMTTGTFTHIFHPNNERMFENASIDIIVFRYCNNPSIEKLVLYNGVQQYIKNREGLITFGENAGESAKFGDYFDVYVGMVTGKEEVYKNAELGNLSVLNGEDKIDRYIYIAKFPCYDERVNQYLLQHKPVLIDRKIRKFGEHNWFEWGALRNFTAINANMGRDCIYINTLTRKPAVAFAGKVTYFGGGLIMLIPKKTCNLNNIVAYLNSSEFKANFTFSGRFKIGHRQICNSDFHSML